MAKAHRSFLLLLVVRDGQESLDAFSRPYPHAIVARLRKVMDHSVFVSYPAGQDSLPADWDAAIARLTRKEAAK
jgi:hypothetical protein